MLFSFLLQTCKLLTSFLMAMVMVWHFQYYQPMVINSLVCSFIPVAIVLLQTQDTTMQGSPGGVRAIGVNLAKTALKSIGSLLAACSLNAIIKVCT